MDANGLEILPVAPSSDEDTAVQRAREVLSPPEPLAFEDPDTGPLPAYRVPWWQVALGLGVALWRHWTGRR